jgi:gamma-glutamylcyclotransferase (GGCT)/AIG2-like uncharacterized protein YtfP
MTKIRCAFYGSLRRPLYNYRKIVLAFGQNSISYLRTTDLKGFEMYLVNPLFPGIKHSDPDKSIVVDLFDVDDDPFFQIKCMEESAGYFEDDITIDGKRCIIFPYALDISKYELIKSGDWLEFLNRETNKLVLNL